MVPTDDFFYLVGTDEGWLLDWLRSMKPPFVLDTAHAGYRLILHPELQQAVKTRKHLGMKACGPVK